MGTEQNRTEGQPDAQGAAERLLETVPKVMRIISTEAQASGISGALTTTQLRALGLLELGQRLPSELARELRFTPATASEVVDLLVRRGLIERCGQPADRRLTPLCITPAGSAQREVARGKALAALRLLLAPLSVPELEVLERGLGSLAGLLREKPAAGGGGKHVE